jgi:hypothetical protein
MKPLRTAILVLCIGVLAIPCVAAGEGAIVSRTEFGEWIGYEWGGENTISLHSTNSEFYCGPGYEITYTYQQIDRPYEHFMTWYWGSLFTRVWFATEDDLFATGDPFDFICNGEHVAEGIAHITQFDNDPTVSGPGANVWGWHWAGTLQDVSGACMTEMWDFNSIRRWRILPGSDWPACAPDCEIPQKIKGPELECTE